VEINPFSEAEPGLVMCDLILGWFLKNTQIQTRGSTELLFKNLLYDVPKEKVWRS
jgi:hypothetical protein